MHDIIVGILLVSGGFFACVAGLGILRFPDVLMRMHASTKASTLGVGLILTAVAIYFGTLEMIARSAATIIFLLLTAPVAAHLLGKAAYRTGAVLWQGMSKDELKDYAETEQESQ